MAASLTTGCTGGANGHWSEFASQIGATGVQVSFRLDWALLNHT